MSVIEARKQLDGILATLESIQEEPDIYFEILGDVHQELLERVRYVRNELNSM